MFVLTQWTTNHLLDYLHKVHLINRCNHLNYSRIPEFNICKFFYKTTLKQIKQLVSWIAYYIFEANIRMRNSHGDGRMEVWPLIMVSMKEIWSNNRKARDYILGFRFCAPLCWKGKHQHSYTELRLKANTGAYYSLIPFNLKYNYCWCRQNIYSRLIIFKC